MVAWGLVRRIAQLRRVVATLRSVHREAFLRLITLPGEHYGKFRINVRIRSKAATDS